MPDLPENSAASQQGPAPRSFPRTALKAIRKAFPVLALLVSIVLVVVGGINDPWIRMAASFMLTMAGIVWIQRMRFQALQQVLDADFKLCRHCRYPLGHLDDDGVCPECATPFNADALRAKWEYEYRKEIQYLAKKNRLKPAIGRDQDTVSDGERPRNV